MSCLKLPASQEHRRGWSPGALTPGPGLLFSTPVSQQVLASH